MSILLPGAGIVGAGMKSAAQQTFTKAAWEATSVALGDAVTQQIGTGKVNPVQSAEAGLMGGIFGAAIPAVGSKLSSTTNRLFNRGASSAVSKSAGNVLKIGDDVVELTGENIAGTNYNKIRPTQDWINMNQVDDYASMLRAGKKLPPIEVYEVSGKGYFIQDGHHRFVASQITEVPVGIKVLPGSGPVGLPNWIDVLP